MDGPQAVSDDVRTRTVSEQSSDTALRADPIPTQGFNCTVVPSTQAYAAKQRAKEDERDAQEAAQRAEVERAEAERRAAEDAEADQWMGMISTEGEGTEEAALQEESQVRLRTAACDHRHAQAAQGIARGQISLGQGSTGSKESAASHGPCCTRRCADAGAVCPTADSAARALGHAVNISFIRPVQLRDRTAAGAGAAGAVRGLHKGPQDRDAG